MNFPVSDVRNPYTFAFVLVLAVAVDVWVFYDACASLYHYIKEVF